ncbi:enoyl-[acyl-carrier-protein] reductase, mitochondrial [Neodiprion pinetum]|uniref:enoyl-[acyl-carrier-protein] reductase, mitochondrial n=1 Tax=Neodiprion pinetum TaxID=441929 RepID=UPI001EDFDBFB|nr:enoyl-[acyl-carrier-protein] reductase, mitochondrial [Neodiprion pinetum]
MASLQVRKYFATASRTLLNVDFVTTRLMSACSSEISTKYLRYQEYGEPVKVLSINTEKLAKPNDNQVTVKWILSPVNPADINTIQGKYASKPPLPAIPGNEGVGEILQVGAGVKNLQLGDKVVPNSGHIGTWRTHAVYDAQELLKIPKELGNLEASMLNVNPCTAYRMLKDFECLKPGDSVLQNGGNSAVGQNVIQLCKVWGFKCVSVVRDRPTISKLKDELINLGATEVLTEEEIRTTSIFKNKLPRPKLALNCIGGKSALELLRHLDKNGTIVTYGGMSREPVTVPTSALIFKNITVKGFWATAWTNSNTDSKERREMYDELAQLLISKNLKPPAAKIVPFNKYQEAVMNTLSIVGKTGLKYILDMTKE